MERNCGKCLLWQQNNQVCPIFQEKMNETEMGCPKFVGEFIPCDVCGNVIVGKRDICLIKDEEWAKVCASCFERWGQCQTCVQATQCDFETNPINIPKQIQKTIQQGNMVAQIIIRNPDREAETCAKNCPCWDDEIKICYRQYLNGQGCVSWSPRLIKNNM